MKGLILLISLLISGVLLGQNANKMEVAVWDTYVTRKDGRIMHFDIIAPASLKDAKVIYGFGNEYLKGKGEEGQELSASECRFCHIESVKPNWEKVINEQGYYIFEMQNCD